ncbi:hypothetical protein DTL70_01250 [Streptomyces diacarni]|uniref:Uncharacterized protein n=1 Tax=Streptomyces diacarni TaxID=2800381 RepID=A0A367FGT2_9ACTN|nr:hypothetical protein DTL70_01250 [Streptomyces diacarni]
MRSFLRCGCDLLCGRGLRTAGEPSARPASHRGASAGGRAGPPSPKRAGEAASSPVISTGTVLCFFPSSRPRSRCGGRAP